MLSLQSGTPELVFVLNSEDEIELPEEPLIEVKMQSYIYAVCTTMKLWIGLVQDVPDEHGDFLSISCILMDRPSCFIGQTKMTCWIGESDIICVIDAPSLSHSQRMYCLNKKDNDKIARLTE